jgi:hypothetical protein
VSVQFIVWSPALCLFQVRLSLYNRLKQPISDPERPDVVQLRTEMLTAAGAAFPALGRDILPRTLQPMQEHRCTASELEQALLGIKIAPPIPPAAAADSTVANTSGAGGTGAEERASAEQVSCMLTSVFHI